MPYIKITRWLAFIFILVTIAITSSGCSNNEAIDVVKFEPKDYQVYFYSNQSNEPVEDTYLDAMLELKTTYPSEINQFELEETTADSLSDQSIVEYPAMVIIKDGETIRTLSGEASKTEIFQELKQTVEPDNKSAVPKS